MHYPHGHLSISYLPGLSHWNRTIRLTLVEVEEHLVPSPVGGRTGSTRVRSFRYELGCFPRGTSEARIVKKGGGTYGLIILLVIVHLVGTTRHVQFYEFGRSDRSTCNCTMSTIGRPNIPRSHPSLLIHPRKTPPAAIKSYRIKRLDGTITRKGSKEARDCGGDVAQPKASCCGAAKNVVRYGCAR